LKIKSSSLSILLIFLITVTFIIARSVENRERKRKTIKNQCGKPVENDGENRRAL